MNTAGKTIQIFLPTGDPSGLRLAEITTRIVQVVEIPRPQLDTFLAREESKSVGAYFLIARGESEVADQSVYVGETEELGARLKQHHASKDFWDRALCVISRTHSLTKTHVRFLEWLCIQEIKKADRFKLVNGNASACPHVSEALKAEILEVFDTARTLLSTLGFQLFDPLVADAIKADAHTRFYCKGAGGAQGEGYYTNEGFVVLKGSIARKDPVSSFLKYKRNKERDELIAAEKLLDQGDHLVYAEDVLHNSPSAAAICVLGRNASGWKEWKNIDGVDLDTIYRTPNDTEATQ